jgi:hypothetical protein
LKSVNFLLIPDLSAFLIFRFRINQFEPLPDMLTVSTSDSVPYTPPPSGSIKADRNNTDFKSSEKLCSMCGFQFTMFKRQHHCRLCNCVCCDDCSKKRVHINNTPVSVLFSSLLF